MQQDPSTFCEFSYHKSNFNISHYKDLIKIFFTLMIVISLEGWLVFPRVLISV